MTFHCISCVKSHSLPFKLYQIIMIIINVFSKIHKIIIIMINQFGWKSIQWIKVLDFRFIEFLCGYPQINYLKYFIDPFIYYGNNSKKLGEKCVIDAWWDLFHFSSNHKLPIVSHEFSLSSTGAFQIFYYINMHWYYVKPLPPIVTNEEKKIGKFFYVHVQVQLLLLYYLLDRLHPGRKKQ